MPGNFVQITPVVSVPTLDEGLAFFRDLLGFTPYVVGGGYAYLEREGVGVRLLDHAATEGSSPGNRRFNVYIDVKDVDAVYADLKPKLDQLPPGDVHGPADKSYGQRELCILAPDGNLLVFGAPMAK